MLPEVPPSEYTVKQVGWQLLDGNSSRLKTWGYSAEIPAEMLEVFFAPKEREKRAESNRRRAGETVRAACGRSARLSSCGRECPLGTICSKIVPEAASLTLATSFTLRKNRPQLFLTPRVKRQCSDCGLHFAGSGLAEGLYIRAVVGTGRRYSVGTPRTRATYQSSLSPVWPTGPEGGRLRWRPA